MHIKLEYVNKLINKMVYNLGRMRKESMSRRGSVWFKMLQNFSKQNYCKAIVNSQVSIIKEIVGKIFQSRCIPHVYQCCCIENFAAQAQIFHRIYAQRFQHNCLQEGLYAALLGACKVLALKHNFQLLSHSTFEQQAEHAGE